MQRTKLMIIFTIIAVLAFNAAATNLMHFPTAFDELNQNTSSVTVNFHHSAFGSQNFTIDALNLTNGNNNIPVIFSNTDFANVQPFSQQSVALTANMSNNPLHGAYTGFMNVHSSGTYFNYIQGIQQIIFNVPKTVDYQVALQKSAIVVDDANPSLTFNITNTGNHNEAVSFRVKSIGNGATTLAQNGTNVTQTISKDQVYAYSFPLSSVNANTTLGNYDVVFEITKGSEFTKEYTFTVEAREKLKSLKVTPENLEVELSADKRTATLNLTIENNGETNLTGIEYRVKNNLASILLNETINLTVGQEYNVSRTFTSPIAFELGTFGTIEVVHPSIQTITSTITTEKVNALEIEKVMVYINDNRETVKRSGAKVKDEIKPGDFLEAEMKVCNLYSKSSDIEISNIEIDADISGIDSDFTVTGDDFDLEAGDCETIKIDFDTDLVPYDTDDGSYGFDIELVGEDDLGFAQELTFETEVEVERERDDFRITSFKPNVNEINLCEDNTIDLSARVYNIGTDDEQELSIRVSNDKQNYQDEKRFTLDVDRDDSFSFRTEINKVGTHTFVAEIYDEETGELYTSETTSVLASSCNIEMDFEESNTESNKVEFLDFDDSSLIDLFAKLDQIEKAESTKSKTSININWKALGIAMIPILLVIAFIALIFKIKKD